MAGCRFDHRDGFDFWGIGQACLVPDSVRPRRRSGARAGVWPSARSRRPEN